MTSCSSRSRSGEIDRVEHLLDDGGALTTTEHRLAVEVDHQQTLVHVIRQRAVLGGADQWRPQRAEQSAAADRRHRRRHGRRLAAFLIEKLVDHLGALSHRTRAVPGMRRDSSGDLQQTYIQNTCRSAPITVVPRSVRPIIEFRKVPELFPQT